ncbi:MAG: hypothetical protein NC200_05985 [Candidatus Gastranaerophilales bacterium]|nr:hypothetical protein [Candidatus Gastranaerophilales bacterium]
MSNFHFIDVKPSIDRSEVASIKEAIFKRAREKSNSLATEKSENYTSQIQNDVMEIARAGLQESPMNPFNQFMENMGLNSSASVAETTEAKPVEKAETPDLKEIYTKEVKRNIESASNGAYTKSVKEETMAAARNQFRQGTSLMATLNFLNTQAAIRMAEDAHSKINYMI